MLIETTARLLKDSEILLDSIAVSIDLIQPTPTKLGSWSGELEGPLEPLWAVMSGDAKFRIELADGRSGDAFFIRVTPITGKIAAASFDGTEPLE